MQPARILQENAGGPVIDCLEEHALH